MTDKNLEEKIILSEISEEDNIQLEIVRDEISTFVETKIAKGVSMGSNVTNAILLNPVYINEKLLKFNDMKNIVINLICVKQSAQPVIFRNVGVKDIKISEKKFLIVATRNGGAKYNRRKSFRINADIQGVVDNEKTVIHDVGFTGLSFYMPESNRKIVGSQVNVKIVDNYEPFMVRATIVREIKLETRFLYGCTIATNIHMEKFIANLQRKQLMKLRR